MKAAVRAMADEAKMPSLSEKTARAFSWEESSIEGALRPLDALRLSFFRMAGPIALPFVRSRSLRIASQASLALAVLFVGALHAPILFLVLGPLLLGVPHLMADLRYLFLRPSFSASRQLAWTILIAVAMWPSKSAFVAAFAMAWIALRVSSHWIRVAIVLMVAGGLFCFASNDLDSTHRFLAHLHNVLALVFWFCWTRNKRVTGVIALSTLTLAAVVFLCAPAQLLGWRPPFYPTEREVQFWRGTQWLSLFAFLQAVHYAIWLRWIPEEDRVQNTPRSFAASYRALRQELGNAVVLGAAFLILCFAVGLFFEPLFSRRLYLDLALVHGPFELAALSELFAKSTKSIDLRAQKSLSKERLPAFVMASVS